MEILLGSRGSSLASGFRRHFNNEKTRFTNYINWHWNDMTCLRSASFIFLCCTSFMLIIKIITLLLKQIQSKLAPIINQYNQYFKRYERNNRLTWYYEKALKFEEDLLLKLPWIDNTTWLYIKWEWREHGYEIIKENSSYIAVSYGLTIPSWLVIDTKFFSCMTALIGIIYEIFRGVRWLPCSLGIWRMSYEWRNSWR